MPRYAAMVLPALQNKRYGYFPRLLLHGELPMKASFQNKYVNDAKLRLLWGMKQAWQVSALIMLPLSLSGAGGASYNGSAGFQIHRTHVR